MIIVTSERTKGSNRKDQEGEARETIARWRVGRGTRRMTEAEGEKKEDKIARELRSPTLNPIVSTNRHNSHTHERTNKDSYCDRPVIRRVCDVSRHIPVTSQTDTTHAVDTSNAFCKLFVVISWLSTPMFCLISHFPRCSYYFFNSRSYPFFPRFVGIAWEEGSR